YNVRAERSLSTFHTAHRLSVSETWRIPSAREQNTHRFHSLIDGWEVGGVVTLQSGRPFTVNRALPQSATSADFGVFDRPDAIADPYRPGPVISHSDPACHTTVSAGGRAPERVGTPTAWINPCAFAAPSAPRFGTAGRNSVIGPSLKDFDLLIAKKFALRE